MTMNFKKRKVEVLILSDIHLGTYGCHANELLQYLKSIAPERLVLNGDIIDIWQFSKRYWPKSHMKVIRQLVEFWSKGVPVHYITGNHDEMLRKFSGFSLGSLKISDKLILELDGKKAWIFHGDVFDVTMKYSKWLTRLGSIGYGMLILLNRFVNFISVSVLGRGKVSFSRRIKNSVKSAVKFINDFEQVAVDIASENGYDYVVCGHIHQPAIKRYLSGKGPVYYLNSGDWIENLTALEYNQGKWRLYHYADDGAVRNISLLDTEGEEVKSSKELFNHLVRELHIQL